MTFSKPAHVTRVSSGPKVNNWMMNVRVRRCRTKKIGVATGPEQLSYPAKKPKAMAMNRDCPSPRPAPARSPNRSPPSTSRNNESKFHNDQSNTANDPAQATRSDHHQNNNNNNSNSSEKHADMYVSKIEFPKDQSCMYEQQSGEISNDHRPVGLAGNDRTPEGVMATSWHP